MASEVFITRRGDGYTWKKALHFGGGGQYTGIGVGGGDDGPYSGGSGGYDLVSTGGIIGEYDGGWIGCGNDGYYCPTGGINSNTSSYDEFLNMKYGGGIGIWDGTTLVANFSCGGGIESGIVII